jgi:hypothetical protein
MRTPPPPIPKRPNQIPKKITIRLKSIGGVTNDPVLFDEFGAHWALQVTDGKDFYLHHIGYGEDDELVYVVHEDSFPEKGIFSKSYTLKMDQSIDQRLAVLKQFSLAWENGGYHWQWNNCQRFAKGALKILVGRFSWVPCTDMEKVKYCVGTAVLSAGALLGYFCVSEDKKSKIITLFKGLAKSKEEVEAEDEVKIEEKKSRKSQVKSWILKTMRM